MSDAIDAIHEAVRAGLPGGVVLAVSGGRDSMVLLDAAAGVARERVAGVATFDHGTGPAATAAAALVGRAAAARGLPVASGCAAVAASTEAAWRDARWRFLRAAAATLGGSAVATAHTRDDQIETVAMRVLRGAGARGAAGLAARSAGVVRPLVGCPRAAVAAYAAERGVPYLDDPTNRSLRHLRNRLRHELLPALERASPGLGEALAATGAAAAAWRAEVDAFVDRWLDVRVGTDGELRVARAVLRGYDPASLAVLWPAIAARAGVRLDRRGTRRVVEFTTRSAAEAATGATIQLAGRVEVVAGRGDLVLRRVPAGRGVPAEPSWDREVAVGGADGEVRVGGWRLRAGGGPAGEGPWSATLPAGGGVTVRAWRPGDRMAGGDGGSARRVKRYLADARIPASERQGWPVVLVGGAIVWIPGVRRSDAATVRQGEPGICYTCERIRT